MHSMLRQNQVRSQDVKPYIRAFTRNNPVDLGEWAKEEGSLFEPGTLIFLLEPAKKPPGMTSFARGQQGSTEASPDAFRVKDMCVVVDKVDGKCWVLAISPSAFELRFIDTLFREKAQKAFLEGLDFNYLSAQPRPTLSQEKLKDLRQLSTLYSKSGSRRTMAQDEGGPEEPAKAMLAFLGADLGPNAAKQVMELGLICNLIFAPEGEQENKMQSMVKACFSPILSTDKLKGQAPPTPPSTAKIIENKELLNEEVSLLTQAYLANEAKEAEDHLKYAPPGDAAIPATDHSQSSGVWTSSTAAAASSQSMPTDEFKPMTPPPAFDMGGFQPPGASSQPASLNLSPDIPSILTGDHQIIVIDQKLAPKESNGSSETKVPSMPAWYLTTHNVDEMNQVALRRAQEAPAIPEGLERLESELSYDALPVVDARFKPDGGAPQPQEFAAPPNPPATYSEQFSVDMLTGEAGARSQPDSGASGAWTAGVAGGAVEKDFVDSIFENSGSRGTIEVTSQAPAAEKKETRPSDWQPVDEPVPGSGFVSPGSLAVPTADTGKNANLFERISGQAAEEAPSTPSWADGGRASGGVPTNLKDMLTADSAVFSTASGSSKLEMPPMLGLETPPSSTPSTEPPSGFDTGASASPFAAPSPSVSEPATTSSATEADSSPAPWMNLPHHKPAAADLTNETPASAESVPAAQDNYNELATALNGLMDSPDAIDGKSKSESLPDVSSQEVLEQAIPESDLFEDVMDKVMDLAETKPEPEQQDPYYEDNHDMTMDLDTAMLQKLSGGPATLTSPGLAPETEPEVADLSSSASTPSFTPEPTSLVSPAMAAHAQSMTEPAAETTAMPAAESVPEQAASDVAPEATVSSDTTPIRPGRSRYRRGVPPRMTPGISPEPTREAAEPAAETVAVTAKIEPPADLVSDAAPLIPEPPITAPEPAAEPLEAAAAPVVNENDFYDEVLEPAATTTAAPEAPSTSREGFFESPELADETTASTAAPSSGSQAFDDVSEPEPPVVSTPPSSVSTPSSTFSTSSPSTSTPVVPPQVEPVDNLDESGVFLTDKDVDDKPAPYGLDLKPLSASGVQRSQPSVEPKLVISESTRFMARLNQRLSEADKKLSSRCEQSRDRLNRELDALIEDARKVERQNELSTGTLTEQLVQHLETVSEEVKAKVSKTSSEAHDEVQQLIKYAEDNVVQMHKEMLKELEATENNFQSETNAMSDATRSNLNEHAQNRLTDFNKKLEEITTALETTYSHHVDLLLARFNKFEARLNEEVDAIVNSLDRNVGSMTVEIDGSWDRASEKLTASQGEFGNSVNYLVHSCRADIKQVHLDLYAKQVLPRLLENKDIFRSMLLDMKRNFEEQSEKIRKKQLNGLTTSIDNAKSQLNSLTKECLSTIESVGKGQQFGLEDLFKSTNSKLEEIITTVESRLKTAKQQIIDNDEACMKTSESSRVEDEPAFSREKQQAIAALNECRTKADNALETHISSSCLDLEQLSEQMQEDLAKQRQDWTAQVRVSADESIAQVKQAIQDAFQAIETAKEKHME
jgi:hypothetical protein